MATFESLAEAEKFKMENYEALLALELEVEAIPGVVYSEIWLNGNSSSFVVGLNYEDQHFVAIKI